MQLHCSSLFSHHPSSLGHQGRLAISPPFWGTTLITQDEYFKEISKGSESLITYNHPRPSSPLDLGPRLTSTPAFPFVYMDMSV